MKMRASPVLSIALLAGGALLLDLYALTRNPAPAANARVELPPPVAAEAARSLSGESEGAPNVALNPRGSAEQVSRDGRGSAAGEALRGVSPVFAAGQSSPDKDALAADSTPEIRPARVAAPIAPVPSDADAASSEALVPLAFRPLPPALAAANPRLADALHGLQQDFVDAVGLSQNPNDPAYYQRWVAAQAAIDERFRLLVGNEDFLLEQMAVNNR
jgi:hypothetical protein